MEFDRLLAEAHRAEQVRQRSHERDAGRQRGVAWSGLGPDVFRSRSDEVLAAEATQRLRMIEAWRTSREGRLLGTLGDVQRAAEAAYAIAEAGRAALARGSAPSQALGGLAAQVAALARAARDAETLMDAGPPSALSQGPCATSTASNSP
jgi:hypothetical protein